MMMTKRAFRSGAIFLGVLTVSLLASRGLTRGDNRVILTVAGSGVQGFTADGGVALDAKLGTLQGIAADRSGNIYVAEVQNNTIRRIDASGRIFQVAGLGPDSVGYNGDDQLATQAKLATPAGVALDSAGNVYIADNGNHRVRRIDSSGIITTVAGTGDPGFSGDGGLAQLSQLSYPSSITFDTADNMYIADVGNFRVRRIDRASGMISTVAGTGGYGFAGDGGPATLATFKGVGGVAISPSGDLFVSDPLNHRVRRISGGIITTAAGTGSSTFGTIEEYGDGGPALNAVVRYPLGLAFDQVGNLYIAENFSNRVRRVDTDGTISTAAGSGHPLQGGGFGGDNGLANQALLNGPSGVALDSAGNLFVTDSRNYRVRKVNAQ